MTAACSHGVTAESWIDFFTGELDEEAGERLEQLLFECAHCAAEAERWGTVIGGVEIAIPPVLSTKALLALQDRGEPMNENVMQPGERRRASFPDGPGLLIHRLQGSELGSADSVSLELSTAEGASLVRFEDVPFNGATGEVIVACQRHFGESFPANIVFEIERRIVDEVEVVARYTIEHTDWV
jgi:hypothetical protein